MWSDTHTKNNREQTKKKSVNFKSGIAKVGERMRAKNEKKTATLSETSAQLRVGWTMAKNDKKEEIMKTN